jgi:hypothetical protein
LFHNAGASVEYFALELSSETNLGGWRTLEELGRIWVAGGAPLKSLDEFGCRILVVFEGAGFDFSFSVFLVHPVTLSAQNRSSTAGGSDQ